MSFIDKIIALDSVSQLYDFKLTKSNVHMYPLIRFTLMRHAINEKLNLKAVDNPVSIIQKIICCVKIFALSPWLPFPSKKYIYFGCDIANVKKGDKYFNRLSEFFAEESKDSIIFERHNNWSYKRPRSFPIVYPTEFINLKAGIKSLFQRRVDDDVKIEQFISVLKDKFAYKFKDAKVWQYVRNSLHSFSSNLDLLEKDYKLLLKEISPKMIFVECACYGGRNVPLIIAAKKLGIKVVEYQHGFLSYSHDAYNYSSNILEEYKCYLPDEMLFYGDYWRNNSRLPIKTSSIGNPFLEENVAKIVKTEKKDHILYISSVSYPEKNVEDVLFLVNSGLNVVFRPHPKEFSRLENVYKPFLEQNIRIDKGLLYDSLNEARFVVSGGATTVIFEAAAFNCVVFLLKDPFSDENIKEETFNYVNDIKGVVSKIKIDDYIENDPSIFWKNNWKNNFDEFIKSYDI